MGGVDNKGSDPTTIAAIYAAQMAEQSEGGAKDEAPEEPVTQPEADTDGADPGSSGASPAPEKVIVGDLDLSSYNLPPDAVERLKKGFLREADYTRKTQKLAEERQTLEQEALQARQLREFFIQNPDIEQTLRLEIQKKQNGQNGTHVPENFDELSPREQFEHIANFAARKAAQIIEPRIKSVESKLEREEREDKEYQELIREYPEAVKFGKDHEITVKVDQLLRENPRLTMLDAYEKVIAKRLQGEAEEGRRMATATRRSAASVEKPARGTNAEPSVDVRKARNNDEAWRWAFEDYQRKSRLT